MVRTAGISSCTACSSCWSFSTCQKGSCQRWAKDGQAGKRVAPPGNRQNPLLMILLHQARRPHSLQNRERDTSRMSLLEAQAVSKAYGGIRALDTCSISVEQGTIAGLIGPNGSGKT